MAALAHWSVIILPKIARAHGNAAPVVPRGDIDEQTVGTVFYIAKEQPTSAKVPLLTQRGALTDETQKN